MTYGTALHPPRRALRAALVAALAGLFLLVAIVLVLIATTPQPPLA